MAETVTAFGALRNLRIIDLTQMLAGPYGTMMLADHPVKALTAFLPGVPHVAQNNNRAQI